MRIVKKLKSLIRYLLPRNLRTDRVVASIPFDTISMSKKIEGIQMNINQEKYTDWVKTWYPEWKKQFGDMYHKKILEFFISYILLAPKQEDAFMDVAGGQKSYVFKLPCSRLIVQDIRISDTFRTEGGDGVEYIEGNASTIPLQNCSIDKICCHHSFEHFQGNADSEFIKEIQRLLAPNGHCCIVPIFITHPYAEITDQFKNDFHFDPAAKYIRDMTSTIPGGDTCGNFARTYDIKALEKRVLNLIDISKFHVSIIEIHINNCAVPNMKLPCHNGVSKINYPYRALLIKKLS